MPTKRQLALIHVAKAQLRLDDDDYRALLLRVGGVSSSKGLSRDGFDAVMGAMERLGFDPLGVVGPHYGERPGMATPAQVQFIRDLWRDYAGRFDGKALDAWLAASFGVSSLRFADAATAGKAITGLRAMTRRRRATG